MIWIHVDFLAAFIQARILQENVVIARPQWQESIPSQGTYEAWKDADAMEAQLKQEKEQEAAQELPIGMECQPFRILEDYQERSRTRKGLFLIQISFWWQGFGQHGYR